VEGVPEERVTAEEKAEDPLTLSDERVPRDVTCDCAADTERRLPNNKASDSVTLCLCGRN